MGEVGNTRSESRSNIVCLEGNGARPSHRGIGFLESEIMYTLNTTEVHSVAYEIHSIGTPSERFKDKDSRGRNLSEPNKYDGYGGKQCAIGTLLLQTEKSAEQG